jgi:phenylacetate-CoA ligase
MSDAYYDQLEIRHPEAREAALFGLLPDLIRRAMTTEGWAEQLAGIDPRSVDSREALASQASTVRWLCDLGCCRLPTYFPVPRTDLRA